MHKFIGLYMSIPYMVLIPYKFSYYLIRTVYLSGEEPIQTELQVDYL